jgi:DNA polymerase III subunit gamma/tau
MSYLVLARKWRPQTFAEIIGQPHVSQTLQNAIESRRVAHAYLFTGARGVGKTSVARIFAKALNCEQGLSAQPCNGCSNCREITQGNAVDVLEIDGASNTGVDNIRELRETIRYRPAKSRYKIYIIDEVHMLSTAAFNALLKTLEEPPEHIVFIFATTEPHKIPATILSRCQRFDFRRIATGQIVAHLGNIARQEQLQLQETVLYAIAREAEGSMRDAQSLLEQVLAFSVDGQVDVEVLDLLGVIDRQSVQRVGRAILAGDPQSCLEVVADLYQRGIDIRRFCHQLCEYFRNLAYLSVVGEAAGGHLDLPAEEVKALEQDLAQTSTESLQLYFQMILKGEEDLRRSTLPRMALEMLLLRLTQLPRLESLQGIMGQLAALESRLDRGGDSHQDPLASVDTVQRHYRADVAGTSGVTSKTNPAAALEAPTLDAAAPAKSQRSTASGGGLSCGSAAEAAGHWPKFLRWLTDRDPMLAAKLGQSQAVASADQKLCLELHTVPIYEDFLKDGKALERLTDAARTFFGLSLTWRICALQPPDAGHVPGAKSQSTRAKSHIKVMEHPIVQQALEILGGELVDIRHLKPAARKRQASLSETPASPDEPSAAE